ncbi:MAG: sugar transporter permease [Phycisphaerales bacterium]|nr:sugar transporter permease [Phycisphaerales bacterium]
MRPVATSPDTAPPRPRGPHRLRRFLDRNPAVYSSVGLGLLVVAMACLSGQFLSAANLGNVLRQVSVNAILAAGMTVVILSGGIDLSVGAVMALSMTAAAGAMLAGVPVPLAVLLALAAGAVCGAVNGVLVAYVGLPAIIVTLAMMEVPRGVALLYTKGYPLSGLPTAFAFWGRGQVFGVQTPILVMLAVFASAYVMLDHYPVGRYLYGIGGNEEAVRLSGVRVRRYRLLAYTLSGFAAAVGGVVLSSRLMSGQPNAGEGFELDAIAAVVLGGTSITGGRGHIAGTLVGALMLGVLNNGLNLMEVSPYAQRVLKGVVIVLAIYAGTSRRRDR